MDRAFLVHLDDVGATAGSVMAWTALRAAGVVRSASVMVPCPYYRFALEDYLHDPDQDLGIHITLTSEWNRYRWAPMTGRSGGLVDHEGFFHRRPEAVQNHADVSAVEDEMAAQIERAIADGIRPTHLDAHMGTAFLPPYVERLWALADKHKLAVPLCRDISVLFDIVKLAAVDAGYFRELLAEADHRGDPVFESFMIGFTPETSRAEDFYADMIARAGDGMHWLAIHANAPDDTACFAPHMTWPRNEEYRLFSDPTSAELFSGSRLVNWHDLNEESARKCA